MDALYYSNYCKHCQQMLQYLVKNGLSQKLNCLCIDKREKNPETGQIFIVLDRGTKLLLPPNVHSVPSLLLTSQNYRVLVGEEIYKYFAPKVMNENNEATGNNGEPAGYLIQNAANTLNVVSEQYTYYNMTPEELSGKGRGGMRQMHNYIPAEHSSYTIPTPEETYKSDKIGNVSMESLQQKRNEEILTVRPPMSIELDSIAGNVSNVRPPQGIPPPPSTNMNATNHYIQQGLSQQPMHQMMHNQSHQGQGYDPQRRTAPQYYNNTSATSQFGNSHYLVNI